MYDNEKTQAPPSRDEILMQAQIAKMRASGLAGGDMCNARPMGDEERLKELFSYHPPTVETLPRFQALNQAAKNFAEIILLNCPPGHDRSFAIDLVRLARMLANGAVALNGLSL